MRTGEHSGRMARRTFIDLLSRKQSSICEIVSLGSPSKEGESEGTRSELFRFNPLVNLISGPFCKDWLVELEVPLRSGKFAPAGPYTPDTERATFHTAGLLSIMGCEPLYPNRETPVARPGCFLRVISRSFPEDLLRITLYPESGPRVTKSFPLPT